jgi:hypothetical protein
MNAPQVFQLSRILYEAWCSFYYNGGGSKLRVLCSEIITPGYVIEALEQVRDFRLKAVEQFVHSSCNHYIVSKFKVLLELISYSLLLQFQKMIGSA